MAADRRLTAADRQAGALAVIQRADDRLRKRNAAIMEHQAAACDLDDSGVHISLPMDPVTGRPQGWSPRKHNVAKDSRRPEREQPGYLARATRVYESYQRQKAEKEAPPPLSVSLVTIFVGAQAAAQVASEPKYKIIDVTADETEK